MAPLPAPPPAWPRPHPAGWAALIHDHDPYSPSPRPRCRGTPTSAGPCCRRGPTPTPPPRRGRVGKKEKSRGRAAAGPARPPTPPLSLPASLRTAPPPCTWRRGRGTSTPSRRWSPAAATSGRALVACDCVGALAWAWEGGRSGPAVAGRGRWAGRRAPRSQAPPPPPPPPPPRAARRPDAAARSGRGGAGGRHPPAAQPGGRRQCGRQGEGRKQWAAGWAGGPALGLGCGARASHGGEGAVPRGPTASACPSPRVRFAHARPPNPASPCRARESQS